MTEKVYHYPLWIRLWHLANALFCLALIISGISMQFSEPHRFLVRFDQAVTLHNAAAILLTLNYLFFLIGNKLSGNGKHYNPSRKNNFSNLIVQFKYYASGIFKGEKPPFPVSKELKFNPLQQIAYLVVMYGLLPLIFISGWGMFFPEIVPTRVFGISGLFLTDLIHVVAGFIVSMFMVVHIYFCMLGTTVFSSFRSMINGWVEIH
jgi:thiosulfate reductase cytochrome b subunit